jgi:hypothetical protein
MHKILGIIGGRSLMWAKTVTEEPIFDKYQKMFDC